MTHTYHVNLVWHKERSGELSSNELPSTIEVATPPPFQKGREGVWSPEHLFTASVNSCFMTTFLAVAENSKLEFTQFSCEADGKMEQIENKFMMTEIVLRPLLKLKHASDKEKAERILLKTKAACLISNSVKATVTVISDILSA